MIVILPRRRDEALARKRAGQDLWATLTARRRDRLRLLQGTTVVVPSFITIVVVVLLYLSCAATTPARPAVTRCLLRKCVLCVCSVSSGVGEATVERN